MTTTFALLSVLLAAAVPDSAPSPAPAHSAAPRLPLAISPDELFSRRALRQARILIQMRVLQLRDERLECVREALMRQLPDALWPEVPSPSRGSSSAAEAIARCSQLMKF
jgi:hypothetical protein